jgi:hypothetical protein
MASVTIKRLDGETVGLELDAVVAIRTALITRYEELTKLVEDLNGSASVAFLLREMTATQKAYEEFTGDKFPG